MKIIVLITTAFFAVLSIAAFLGALSTAGLFIVLRAAAADLPRKDAPPTLSAPIGKDAPPTLLASIDPVGITRREIERSNWRSKNWRSKCDGVRSTA